jgi:hypothetical protein
MTSPNTVTTTTDDFEDVIASETPTVEAVA